MRLEPEHSFLFWFIQRDTESFGQKVEKNYRIEHFNSLSAWHCFRPLIQRGWFISSAVTWLQEASTGTEYLLKAFYIPFAGDRIQARLFTWEVRHARNKGSD